MYMTEKQKDDYIYKVKWIEDAMNYIAEAAVIILMRLQSNVYTTPAWPLIQKL